MLKSGPFVQVRFNLFVWNFDSFRLPRARLGDLQGKAGAIAPKPTDLLPVTAQPALALGRSVWCGKRAKS